ncbi:MAG: hypothetical protein EBU96_03860 [Actinobacteria bacterium]|nr:hypothetical protein [Actinomycetota bacterium]
MTHKWQINLGSVLMSFIVMVPLSQFGLDFSDESFYLHLSSSLDHSTSGFGPWGAILHPLFAITNNIVGFRLAGVLGLIFAAIYLANGFLDSVVDRGMATPPKFIQALYLFSIPFISLSYFRHLLITPSYNWLNLVGILLVLGVYYRIRFISTVSLKWINLILLNLGLIIATLSRPLSGVILFVGILASREFRYFVFYSKQICLRHLLIQVSILCLIFWFLISPNDILSSWKSALEFSQFDKSHSISNLIKELWVDLGSLLHTPAVGVSAGVLFGVFALQFSKLAESRAGKIYMRLSTILLTACFYLLSLVEITKYGFENTNDALGLISLTVLAVSVARLRKIEIQKSRFEITSKQIICLQKSSASFYLFCIFAFAFSSNNGLIRQSSMAAIIFLVWIIDESLWFKTIKFSNVQETAVVAFSACITVSTLVSGFNAPYRSEAFNWDYSYAVVDTYGSKVKISNDQASVVSSILKSDVAFTDQSENILIDLSPFTTYIYYSLGFKSVETPFWGFQDYAEFLTNKHKGELVNAWLLTSDDKRAIDPIEIASILSKRFPEDYRLVATYSGNLCRNKYCVQRLWAPR